MTVGAGLPALPREADLRVLKIQREEIESARSGVVYAKSSALFFRTTREEALRRNEAATVHLVNSLPSAKSVGVGGAGKRVTFGR